MKNLLVLGIVAVGLAVAMPAMADDFYAVSKLTVSPQVMTDRQLDSVEGTAFACVAICGQRNVILASQNNSFGQTNIRLLSPVTGNLSADLSFQSNSAGQSNGLVVVQSNQ